MEIFGLSETADPRLLRGTTRAGECTLLEYTPIGRDSETRVCREHFLGAGVAHECMTRRCDGSSVGEVTNRDGHPAEASQVSPAI